jgi:hypothetical protein
MWRYALWVYLLRKASKVDLTPLPAHPDRLGGLGFLLFAQRQFGPLGAASGRVVAGHFANEVIVHCRQARHLLLYGLQHL